MGGRGVGWLVLWLTRGVDAWVKNHPVDSIDSVTLDGWLGGLDRSISKPVEKGLAVTLVACVAVLAQAIQGCAVVEQKPVGQLLTEQAVSVASVKDLIFVRAVVHGDE